MFTALIIFKQFKAKFELYNYIMQAYASNSALLHQYRMLLTTPLGRTISNS